MPRDSKPIVLVDPYAQQTLAYTHPDGAPAIQDSRPATGEAGVGSTLRRVLQLALLSSVAVMIWFMLSLLQTTG